MTNVYAGLLDSTIEGNSWIGKCCFVNQSSLLQGCRLSYSIISRCRAVGSLPVKSSQNLELSVGPENNVSHGSRIINANYLTTYSQVVIQAFSTPSSLENKIWETSIISGAILVDCPEVVNCCIGHSSSTSISIVVDACRLKQCTIARSPPHSASEVVLEQSSLTNCILHSPCSVGPRCNLEQVILFEHSSVKDGAFVASSIVGPDSGISQGECHHSLLGPFVGFHHQSLLIATCWPLGRGNIGYGAMIGSFLISSF